MARQPKKGKLAQRPRGQVASQDGDGIAGLLRPTLDAVSRRAHGVVDHVREDAVAVVQEAGRETRRAVKEGERSGRRLARDVRRELDASAEALADRLTDQQDLAEEKVRGLVNEWHAGHHALADSILAKIIAVAITAGLMYGALAVVQAKAEHFSWLAVAKVGWSSSTAFALVLWGVYQASGRHPVLRQVLLWQLYLLATVALAAGSLLASTYFVSGAI